jgi:hypothetical protein
MAAPEKTIVVNYTEDGLSIQLPDDIDPEIKVEVRDYAAPDDWEGERFKDEDGEEYLRTVVRHGECLEPKPHGN